jgi:glutamine---fructose-6-phosphate transaminase (isomerizing)
MSGIVGCIGKGDIPGILLQGLHRMEYLGYDAAGLAMIHEGVLSYEKLAGAVRQLTARIHGDLFQGSIGIAGLQFATHGDPTRANAQPQHDCNGKAAVVHVGVIENLVDVRKRLLAEGHKLRSQTDTEAIAHLVEGRLTGTGFLETFLEILELLAGSYSLLVIDQDRPREIFGACSEAVLWVGSCNGFTIVSSELAPLIAHTRKAIRVEPGSVVRVREDGVEIYGRDGRPRPAEPREIGWTLAQAQRGGYAFHTLKEIHEQPLSIRRAFSSRVGERGVTLHNFGLSRGVLAACDRIRIVGSGSSFHAALVAKSYIEEFARLPVSALPSSEQIASDPVVSPESILVTISQSGKNRDTQQAAWDWHRRGGKVVVIGNCPGSALWREGDGVLGTYSGPEIGVVSTKTYTSALVTSLLFALALGRAKEAIKSAPEKELLFGLQDLPRVVESLLQRESEFDAVAEPLLATRSVFFTGSGLDFATALEGALKLKQLAAIHGEGIPIGEVKHQSLNLVGPDRPVVALAVIDSGYASVLDAIREVKQVQTPVVAIVREGDRQIPPMVDRVVFLPRVAPLLAPVAAAVALQLLAVTVARKLGLDLDSPRHLRKFYG